MSKRMILAGLMAMVLMLSGCALIEKDEAVDAATAIITIGDTVITKGEVNEVLHMYYGDISAEDAQTRRSAQESVVTYIIQQEVMNQKVSELGLDQLTVEEEARVKAQAEAAMQQDREAARKELFANGEADESMIDSYLASLGATQESYEVYARTQLIEEKLMAHAVPDLTITEDELQIELDWMVQQDQLAFQDSLQAYETRVNAGERVYYHPAGYRYVKLIKRTFLPEDQAKITELEDKIASGEALKEELAQVKAAAYANLEGTMGEITQKLAAGEAFDKLLAEYGQDAGSKLSPVKENGYAISADSNDPSYEAVLAGMALKKAGDISNPVKLSDGMGILFYSADIPEGPVALETIKTDLEETLRSTKQEVLFYETLTAWTAQANAKVDYEALDR